MSLSDTYKVNPEKERQGVRFEFGLADPVKHPGKITAFTLSRMSRSNKSYTKSLDRATRPHRRSMELETMNPDVADDVFMDVFVTTILIGWENVLASDVTGIVEDEGFAPFSPASAKLLFKNLPELYEDLMERSRKASGFRDEKQEGEAKN